MNYKTSILLVAIICACALKATAQFSPLYGNACRRIYIKGPDSSFTNLIWSNLGYGDECTQLNETEGFAIDKNLVGLSESKRHIEIKLYKECKDISVNHEDPSTVMTINLFFEHLPDTVDYYLNIPYIKRGTTLNVIVPKKHNHLINSNSCCNALIIRSHPPLVKLIDISNIVFSEKNKSILVR